MLDGSLSTITTSGMADGTTTFALGHLVFLQDHQTVQQIIRTVMPTRIGGSRILGRSRRMKSTPGVFNWAFDFPCEFKFITDGLSNTFLLLERRPEIAVWAGMYRQEQLGVTTGIRPNSSTINEDPTMIKE